MRFPALQSRSFVLYESGNVFAQNGQWITRIVIGWVAWELTQSATWVGLLSFFLFAPTIVASPFFGVLNDRVPLKPTLMVSQGIVTLSTLVLYLLHLAGQLGILSLSVVALVIGVAGSCERAARVAIVPRMVPLSALTNAVAIHASNFNIARMLGPVIGGFLIERYGSGPTMLINVLVLLPFLGLVGFLKVNERPSRKAGRKSFFGDFADGFRAAAAHPIIREALLLTCISSITVRGVQEILPSIADGLFGRGAEGLGQMVAAGGAGALVSAVVVAFRHQRKRPGIPLIGLIAVAIGTLSVAGLGLADNWTLAMILVTINGYAGTMIGINMQTTVQLTVDDAVRGRVMSLYVVLFRAVPAIGALIMGLASEVFGLRWPIIGGAVLLLAVFFWTWSARKRTADALEPIDPVPGSA